MNATLTRIVTIASTAIAWGAFAVPLIVGALLIGRNLLTGQGVDALRGVWGVGSFFLMIAWWTSVPAMMFALVGATGLAVTPFRRTISELVLQGAVAGMIFGMVYIAVLAGDITAIASRFGFGLAVPAGVLSGGGYALVFRNLLRIDDSSLRASER